MAHQIVDQDRAAAHAQRLLCKARQLRGLQVMSEQAATDQIETAVVEGKRERVRDYGAVSAQQMSADAIEVSHIQRDSLVRQLPAGSLGDIAKSSGHFQY